MANEIERGKVINVKGTNYFVLSVYGEQVCLRQMGADGYFVTHPFHCNRAEIVNGILEPKA